MNALIREQLTAYLKPVDTVIGPVKMTWHAIKRYRERNGNRHTSGTGLKRLSELRAVSNLAALLKGAGRAKLKPGNYGQGSFTDYLMCRGWIMVVKEGECVTIYYEPGADGRYEAIESATHAGSEVTDETQLWWEVEYRTSVDGPWEIMGEFRGGNQWNEGTRCITYFPSYSEAKDAEERLVRYSQGWSEDGHGRKPWTLHQSRIVQCSNGIKRIALRPSLHSTSQPPASINVLTGQSFT